MEIYSDYDQEPVEQFLPLPEELYSELYDLEMSNFGEDAPFYLEALKHGSTILELGCGSGRLSGILAGKGHRVTGVDLSPAMISAAQKKAVKNTHYICMDMRLLDLDNRFDAVIIPYNTLNLLPDNQDVLCALLGCHKHLKTGGQLLLQLYIPVATSSDTEEQASFQFQMFDRPEGGKIIKEIIRRHNPVSQRLEMTERYKIRPMQSGQPNINYSHSMLLNVNSGNTWQEMIESAGFRITKTADRYSPESEINPGLLLLRAEKKG